MLQLRESIKQEVLLSILQDVKMLSTKYRLELTDICCRMITTDGVPVTLEERIWMNKLCESNSHARGIAHRLLLNNLV